jgi:hypothetical protein
MGPSKAFQLPLEDIWIEPTSRILGCELLLFWYGTTRFHFGDDLTMLPSILEYDQLSMRRKLPMIQPGEYITKVSFDLSSCSLSTFLKLALKRPFPFRKKLDVYMILRIPPRKHSSLQDESYDQDGCSKELDHMLNSLTPACNELKAHGHHITVLWDDRFNSPVWLSFVKQEKVAADVISQFEDGLASGNKAFPNQLLLTPGLRSYMDDCNRWIGIPSTTN